MALSTRQRWMLYALAGLLTGAAMLAVQPADDDAGAVVAPTVRPVRPMRPMRPAQDGPAVQATRGTPATASAPAALALPQRPHGAAGRSPFGEPAAMAAAAAAASASPPPPDRTPTTQAALAPAFGFLGRWTENGTTTVFLSLGGRRLAAVAGKPLTPDYWVEHIGERELRLRHVPTGTRHSLALVAGRTAATAAAAPPPPATDTEEQN